MPGWLWEEAAEASRAGCKGDRFCAVSCWQFAAAKEGVQATEGSTCSPWRRSAALAVVSTETATGGKGSFSCGATVAAADTEPEGGMCSLRRSVVLAAVGTEAAAGGGSSCVGSGGTAFALPAEEAAAVMRGGGGGPGGGLMGGRRSHQQQCKRWWQQWPKGWRWARLQAEVRAEVVPAAAQALVATGAAGVEGGPAAG